MKKLSMSIIAVVFLLALALPSCASTYTPISKTDCVGNVCQVAIYGGTRFIEEAGKWVSIDKAKSLKDYFNFIYKERDENLNVEVIDFNYTSITLSLNVANKEASKDIPLKIYKEVENYNISKGAIEKTEAKSLEATYRFIDDKEVKTITLPYIFGYDVKFGANSTVITLNQTNSNVNDTHVARYSVVTNYAENVMTYHREYTGANQQDYTLYRVNLSAVLPAAVTITNANLSYFVQTAENGCPSTYWQGWYNLTSTYENYNMNTVNFNTVNATARDVYLNETNTSIGSGSATDRYFYWNVTNFAKDSYTQNKNMSLMSYSVNTGNTCDTVIKTLETVNSTANKPQLVVTYTNGGEINATSTNLTMNGGVGNFTYQYTTTAVNLTAYVNVTALPIWIQVNGTNVSTSTTSTTTQYIFPTGFWNVTSYTPGNTTHSSSLTTIWGTITQVPTSMSLYLDGTQSNRTYSYNPANVNSTGTINVTGLTVNISVNGTFKGSGTTSTEYLSSYPVGLWNITAYYNGNQNYSASYKTYWLNITQATSLCNLETNWEGGGAACVYPNRLNLSCVCNNIENGFNLYRDGVNVNSTENNQFKLLGIGTYNYVCNASAGNYSFATNSTSAGVVQGNASNYTNITFNTSSTISQGTPVTITCNKPSELTATLYNNTSAVSNPYSFIPNTSGVYGFNCTTSANANLTAGFAVNNLTVTGVGGLVINVFNEENQSQGLVFNITVNNGTISNSAYDQSNPYTNNSVSGIITIDISSDGYGSRSYYTTVTPGGNGTYLNASLLPSGSGSWVLFYTYTTTDQAIQNVLVNAERLIPPSSWLTVAQKKTDASGVALLFLSPITTYMINFTLTGYDNYSTQLQPSASPYVIYMSLTSGYNITYNTMFKGVYLEVKPDDAGINYNQTYPFFYYVNSSDASLVFYGWNISTINGTLINFTNVSDTIGGNLTKNINTLNYQYNDTLYLTYWFLKNGYSLFSATNTYRIYNVSAANTSIMAMAGDIQTSGMTADQFAFLSIIITIILMAAGSSQMKMFGSGVIGLGIMALFTSIGTYLYGTAYLIGWTFFGVMALGVISAIWIRGGFG